jgi:uncharacterized membrane protein
MFNVCNNTDKLVSVAFMYYSANCKDQGDFTKVGYYNINPKQCATIFNRDLSSLNQYYYLYAWSADLEWPGSNVPGGILVNIPTDKAFTLCSNVTSNPSRNVTFMEIDIGNNADFTVNLNT